MALKYDFIYPNGQQVYAQKHKSNASDTALVS